MRFYHDLQTRSGFGDRILDLWAAITVARLHNPNSEVLINWHDGFIYSGFIGTYSTNLFSIDGCEFTKCLPQGAFEVEDFFCANKGEHENITQLPNGLNQLLLHNGNTWGQSSPMQIQRDLEFYQLDKNTPLELIIQTYQDVAKSTRPSAIVSQGIPEKIKTYTGIHVRLQDKIVGEEKSWDMTPQTWKSVEIKSSFYIDRCIEKGQIFYVCSDDPIYKKAFIQDLKSRGANLIQINRKKFSEKSPGLDDLIEFFALSQCNNIIQMTKYSTYSMGASIVGSIPLVNVYRGESDAGHLLDIWKDVVILKSI